MDVEYGMESRVFLIDVSYLRVLCGVSGLDDESNGSICDRSCMDACVNGVKCGVGEKDYRKMV